MLGILSGYPDGTFLPEGKVTCAEASTVLLRTLQLDMPQSPYPASKFKWAWEAARIADMFVLAGWEEAFTQKAENLELDQFRSFASSRAISQYKAYLQYVKSLSDVNPNSHVIWHGDFDPVYVNNNIVLTSWYLSFNRKIGDKWYSQNAKTFVITIKRGVDRKWFVDQFPIEIPEANQNENQRTPPMELSREITF